MTHSLATEETVKVISTEAATQKGSGLGQERGSCHGRVPWEAEGGRPGSLVRCAPGDADGLSAAQCRWQPPCLRGGTNGTAFHGARTAVKMNQPQLLAPLG